MLSKRIIPCLDVTDGRVVKGTQFVDLKDAGDAIELAKKYDKEGADELVFLDITASSDKRAILKDLVKKTAKEIFIPFTVGGGINSLEDIKEILTAGADKVSINTAAIKNPDLIASASAHYGSQCIVVAMDAKRYTGENDTAPPSPISEVAIDDLSQWQIYSHGGRNPTGIDAIKWARYMAEAGAGEFLVTSMDQDGTQDGYDIPLTKAVASQSNCPVIASGGAGTVDHIASVLDSCDAALLASLLHFGQLELETIKSHCLSKGLPIRSI